MISWGVSKGLLRMIECLMEILNPLSQFWWIALLSVLFFTGIVFLVPVAVIILPVDYFAGEKRHGIIKEFIFPFNMILLALKNLTGFVLFVFGIILLFIPGQGLLTIFAGLMLMNFPGKRRLELSIVRRKKVLNSINWIREKAGKEPIQDIYNS